MSLPTVSAILRLPALVRAAPEVAAGADHLSNEVRWVHVSELGDISRLLRGGELLLTTGIALDLSPRGLERYVSSLAECRAAGLVVEFGRRLEEIPAAMVGAAERSGLPLVVLRREARFVEVTEQAHAFIIDSQVTELRFRQEIHEAFTEMAVEGADAGAIVGYAARSARRPILLTTLSGAVVHLDAGGWDPGRVLEEWQAAAPLHRFTGRPELLGGRPSWLIYPVRARGEVWGELVLREPGSLAAGRSRIVLERAAGALALNRLVERERLSLELQARRSLLDDLVKGASAAAGVAERAAALGFPLTGTLLVGGEVRWAGAEAPGGGPGAETRAADLGRHVTAAARETGDHVLAAPRPDGRVQLLLSLPATGRVEQRLGRLARAIHARLASRALGEALVAFGGEARDLPYARWSMEEAGQVLDALPGPEGKLFYRAPDIRLRGLLHLLRQDERLVSFAERELRPLLDADRRQRSDLLKVLGTYIAHLGNKAETAAALKMSRPTLYARLRQIEAILNVDLSDGEALASLQVALMARQTVGAAP
jgi:purine catabolism regulator